MSKVRPDQFPGYSSVYINLLRLGSKKTLSEYQRKCVYSPQNVISTHLNKSKNIENLSNSSMELLS